MTPRNVSHSAIADWGVLYLASHIFNRSIEAPGTIGYALPAHTVTLSTSVLYYLSVLDKPDEVYYA